MPRKKIERVFSRLRSKRKSNPKQSRKVKLEEFVSLCPVQSYWYLRWKKLKLLSSQGKNDGGVQGAKKESEKPKNVVRFEQLAEKAREACNETDLEVHQLRLKYLNEFSLQLSVEEYQAWSKVRCTQSTFYSNKHDFISWLPSGIDPSHNKKDCSLRSNEELDFHDTAIEFLSYLIYTLLAEQGQQARQRVLTELGTWERNSENTKSGFRILPRLRKISCTGNNEIKQILDDEVRTDVKQLPILFSRHLSS
mmetsp:Transcript_19036/g.24858  ORF Transcript_19036/g.24858 Transcript_19036/m.24858 type:complete len:251 (+) Transcript_19036:566-1318(+)